MGTKSEYLLLVYPVEWTRDALLWLFGMSSEITTGIWWNWEFASLYPQLPNILLAFFLRSNIQKEDLNRRTGTTGKSWLPNYFSSQCKVYRNFILRSKIDLPLFDTFFPREFTQFPVLLIVHGFVLFLACVHVLYGTNIWSLLHSAQNCGRLGSQADTRAQPNAVWRNSWLVRSFSAYSAANRKTLFFRQFVAFGRLSTFFALLTFQWCKAKQNEERKIMFISCAHTIYHVQVQNWNWGSFLLQIVLRTRASFNAQSLHIWQFHSN